MMHMGKYKHCPVLEVFVSKGQVLLCIGTEVSSPLQGYEQAVDSHNGLVNGGYLSWHHDNLVHSPVPISKATKFQQQRLTAVDKDWGNAQIASADLDKNFKK